MRQIKKLSKAERHVIKKKLYQRGRNEHFNGGTSQYLPGGKSFADVTDVAYKDIIFDYFEIFVVKMNNVHYIKLNYIL